jgi:hypothetical protein
VSSVSPKSGLRPGSRGLQKWGSEVSSHSSKMNMLLNNTLTTNDPRFSHLRMPEIRTRQLSISSASSSHYSFIK